MAMTSDIEKQLDPARLLRAGTEAAGLSDYGDPAFLSPFINFLEASRREIPFSEEGLVGFQADVLRILVNRLRMQSDFIKHPEIEDEDVSDPIVVVGLVRTGTTKLQRMLAADPVSQSIPLWQMLYSSRFPDALPGQPDPRPEFVRQSGGFAAGPAVVSINAAHSMSLDAPDEDIILFENTFAHLYLYLRNPIHSYKDWLKSQPSEMPYQYYRRILKYLQWQNGGRQGRPWVLKCTSHMGELELLLKLFPNATIVHCHRDPYACIPSYSRLQELVWSLRGASPPPKVVGQAMLEVWGDLMRRCISTRQRLDGQCRIVDLSYRRIKDDPISAIREIYAVAGRELTPKAEEGMRAWEHENPQHQFGNHTYSAEYFDLTREQIQQGFSEYLGRFSELI